MPQIFQGYGVAFGTTSTGVLINQNSHGFAVGDVLYLNGSTYAKAVASAANTAEVVGIVSRNISANEFELAATGEVQGLAVSSFTEGSIPAVGEAIFLSPTTAGKLTISEPTTIGSISLPVGVISARSGSPATSCKMYIDIKRGIVVGATNVRTQVSLSNAATSTIQDVSQYEAGRLSGWITITATTSLKFYVEVRFSRNGAGNNFNVSFSTSGDIPPSGFLISITSEGLLQCVMPTIAGFGSASITYGLDVSAIGTSFPLSVPASNIVGDTNPVGTLLDYAGTTAPSGYLMCDGRSLTTAAYPSLFAVVGYAYGGSGANFNIPDFRGRFARYLDNMGGTAAGRDSGRVIGTDQTQATARNGLGVTLANTDLSHTHTIGTGAAATAAGGNFTTPNYDNNGAVRGTNAASVSMNHSHTVTWSGDAETRPINLSCTKIIKF